MFTPKNNARANTDAYLFKTFVLMDAYLHKYKVPFLAHGIKLYIFLMQAFKYRSMFATAIECMGM